LFVHEETERIEREKIDFDTVFKASVQIPAPDMQIGQLLI